MKSLPFFHSIRILTRCEVSLCQDSPFSIHVDEPDDIAIWIDHFIENEELIIQTKPMHYGFLLLNDSYPKIHVACAGLNGIHVLDKAYVSAKEEFQVEKLGNGTIIREMYYSILMNFSFYWKPFGVTQDG